MSSISQLVDSCHVETSISSTGSGALLAVPPRDQLECATPNGTETHRSGCIKSRDLLPALRRFSTIATVTSGAVRVPIDDLDSVAMLRESAARTDQMQRSKPAYGRTSPEMNDVGVLGEHAVHAYLAGLTTGVRLTEPGDFTSGDVQIFRTFTGTDSCGTTFAIEVKTCRFSHWMRHGRTLNQRQLQRMTSEAIMWCVVADALPTESVIIMGWLPLPEVKTANSNKRLRLHGQEHVQSREPMREPRHLVPWIDSFDMAQHRWF